MEVHLLDVQADLYGRTLDLRFIDRIRDEIRFPTPAALVDQIGRDVSRAREILGRERG